MVAVSVIPPFKSMENGRSSVEQVKSRRHKTEGVTSTLMSSESGQSVQSHPRSPLRLPICDLIPSRNPRPILQHDLFLHASRLLRTPVTHSMNPTLSSTTEGTEPIRLVIPRSRHVRPPARAISRSVRRLRPHRTSSPRPDSVLEAYIRIRIELTRKRMRTLHRSAILPSSLLHRWRHNLKGLDGAS